MRRAAAICLALFVVFTLAACGKKMTPTPPDGATYPRQYPNPEKEKQ